KLKMREELVCAASPPLTVRVPAPGPSIVRLGTELAISPVVRVMVPLTSNVMISPGTAKATALRSEPGPLSFRLVTTEGSERSSSNNTVGRKDGVGRRRTGGVRPMRGANIFQNERTMVQTSKN